MRLRQHIGIAGVDALRHFWSGRLLSPSTRCADVETALGPPDRIDGPKLAYRLPVRPNYLYTFVFDTVTGALTEYGYRRAGPSPNPPNLTEAASCGRRLADLGATASELRAWIGEPMEWYGWWPIEVWEYPDGLRLELRHGIVVETSGDL